MQKAVAFMAFAAVIFMSFIGPVAAGVNPIDSWNSGLAAYQKGDYSEAEKLFDDAINNGLDGFRLSYAQTLKGQIAAFNDANAALEKQQYDKAIPLFAKVLQVRSPSASINASISNHIRRFYKSFNPRQVEAGISLGQCFIMIAAQTADEARYNEGLTILKTIWQKNGKGATHNKTIEKILQEGFIALVDKKDYFLDDNLTMVNARYDKLSLTMFQYFLWGEKAREDDLSGDDLEGTLDKITNARVLFYYASVMVKNGKSSEAKKIYERIVNQYQGTDYEKKANSIIAQLAKAGERNR